MREKIEAQFDDGVLTVSIPRDENRKQESTRRIEVQRGAPKGGQQKGQQQAQKSEEEEPRPSARH